MPNILKIRLKRNNFSVFDFIGIEETDTLKLAILACDRAGIAHEVVKDFVENETNSIQYFIHPFELSLTRD